MVLTANQKNIFFGSLLFVGFIGKSRIMTICVRKLLHRPKIITKYMYYNPNYKMRTFHLLQNVISIDRTNYLPSAIFIMISPLDLLKGQP